MEEQLRDPLGAAKFDATGAMLADIERCVLVVCCSLLRGRGHA
jgi:hypothetical protein